MKRLLIVDDSSSIRNRIRRLINDPRLPPIQIVGTAPNGQAALRLFKETSPDVVTMDLTMPEMDGVDCTKALSAHDARAAILVISALTDKITAIRALENGACGFLEKPFTDDQLIEALIEIIS